MRAVVTIMPRRDRTDEKGEALHQAMQKQGASGVKSVRQGNIILLEMEEGATPENVNDLCLNYLVDSEVEDFEVIFEGAAEQE
ncbi:MAG: hypothetical protein GC136_07475 [Alphaproteobacteria bacterium]|nr:hypothetical protein [Alphaproteobacteria bacterium]